jgi:hypothetical protein
MRFPQAILGVWRAVHRNQGWHRLEVLHGGLVLLQMASGISVTGKLECQTDNKCSLRLDLSQTLTLEGTWCLWHETLDFNFLGEYLIFMPMISNLQLPQVRTYAPTLTKSVPHSGEHTVPPYIDGVGANRVFALPHQRFLQIHLESLRKS